jgi:hypothetical protein
LARSPQSYAESCAKFSDGGHDELGARPQAADWVRQGAFRQKQCP